MSYVLDLSDVAAEDLTALIESLPSSCRRDATDRVEEALQRLAANPLLAQRIHLGRPTYHFTFVAEDVHYHWGCTFCYAEDETSIQVTHIFSVPL